MEITEVRIKLTEDSDDRLQAFCSITFDNCFVVRDLKIIEGANGPFVAMPSRKLTAHCPRCRGKNHLRANHCNQCGTRLPQDRAARDDDGRAKLYADIAHPINARCREMIQERVIAAFRAEQELAKQPGYVSRYEDLDYGDYEAAAAEATTAEAAADTVHSTNEPPSQFTAEGRRTEVQSAAAEPRRPHALPAAAGTNAAEGAVTSSDRPAAETSSVRIDRPTSETNSPRIDRPADSVVPPLPTKPTGFGAGILDDR